jgi:Family of unknown function (DUF6084)
MPELVFDCVDVRADLYAAGPTLVFRLKIAETMGERVHAIALRIQLRIEPQRRRYAASEARKLNDLFGDTSRWVDTLKPLQFANATAMVPSFTGSVEVDVPVACTYDLEIAATSYFHALENGDVPFLLLFSGTVFTRGQTGFSVAQVPWHKEASYQLPVSEWRAMMDAFYPNSGWLRLNLETLEALGAFKNARALPTWEHAINTLLDEAERRSTGADA